MGKPSRDKGYRGEAAVVRQALDHGVAAQRVPLSGAAQGYPGDVILHALGEEWVTEVGGPAVLSNYKWKGDNDILVTGVDRNRCWR